MATSHDIIVKVGLTPDQYLHLVRMAAADDRTQSAFMRCLLIKEIFTQAQHEAHASPDAMPSPAQDQA